METPESEEFRRALQRLGRSMALAALLLFSCADEPASPEARVRALIEEAEAGAESRDLEALRRLISERYTDERGGGKHALEMLLAHYLSSHRSVHLLTRIESVTFPEDRSQGTGPARAEASLFVAMAGVPISGADDLARLRADLYRFRFTFAEEGQSEWKLIRAQWQRAQPSDFL